MTRQMAAVARNKARPTWETKNFIWISHWVARTRAREPSLAAPGGAMHTTRKSESCTEPRLEPRDSGAVWGMPSLLPVYPKLPPEACVTINTCVCVIHYGPESMYRMPSPLSEWAKRWVVKVWTDFWSLTENGCLVTEADRKKKFNSGHTDLARLKQRGAEIFNCKLDRSFP